jgi:drug/metabolite transporter (DMT)-like permease
MFRYFSDKNLNIQGIITVNYITCLISTLVVNADTLTYQSMKAETLNVYAFLLGGLFIITFNIMSKTVTHFGIMISSVTQKMSLIAPIMIGVLFYAENLTIFRIIGIIAAMSAIVVINMPFNKDPEQKRKLIFWLYPLLTLLLSSIIDAAFYLLGKSTGSKQSALFLAILFGTAATLGILFMIIHKIKNGLKIPWHIIPYGILLGVPNFMSIHYLMKAIGQGWDASLMFPINNVGIIAISMLGALLIFKEKANKFKLMGIALAISAVLLIALF